ncbi:serine/threonine kinase-like domain-containing protein STKLD1 isoform X1 [Python bivittatus]|uniref:non-specific serine/threonine protein kinase n=1 Tax=Python bivittatus TaxID=176946 RepID=A0A9F5MZ17_PYTBI|nr:serine/threonine kinase-like domain-containing protein STKLD1 isoform X1 [Python bivittatus]
MWILAVQALSERFCIFTQLQLHFKVGDAVLLCFRNLKPSNILSTGEASFMVCDFSSETLMTDEMKWKIRVEEEPDSKCWMAPEALNFSFSDKSDIWSLGSILLDMITCSYVKVKEPLLLLHNIKKEACVLEEAVSTMKQLDPALSSLLFLMLKIDPSLRPTSV